MMHMPIANYVFNLFTLLISQDTLSELNSIALYIPVHNWTIYDHQFPHNGQFSFALVESPAHQ
ncbi:hypothetical protein ACSBR2_007606 [Camellia fascicularis]